MKYIRKILPPPIAHSPLAPGCWLLVTGFWLLTAGFSLQDPGSELQITVTNIYPVKGELYIAVYDNADEYMDIEKAAFQKIQAVSGKTEHIIISGVPDGVYAVTVFQDLNGNGELDTSSIGFPREPFGFSNDARGSFGPPKFRKAKFDVAGNTAISIELDNDEKEEE
jgi:uncharacterized protein (DUF2141 family)